jgi:hypothetical protein
MLASGGVGVSFYKLERRGKHADLFADHFSGKLESTGPVRYTADGAFILVLEETNFSSHTLAVYDIRARARLMGQTLLNVYQMGDTIELSPDDGFAFTSTSDSKIVRWDFDWEYEFPGWSDWDEGANTYLSIFLRLFPEWTELDFDNHLMRQLCQRGYGWLRREGVSAKLNSITV